MVDASTKAMNQDHSTNFRQTGPNRAAKGKRGKPHCLVRQHSVTVPVYAHSLCGRTRYTVAFKQQDGMSVHYMHQLRSVLGIFSRAFPGPIMEMKAEQIEASPVAHTPWSAS